MNSAPREYRRKEETIRTRMVELRALRLAREAREKGTVIVDHRYAGEMILAIIGVLLFALY